MKGKIGCDLNIREDLTIIAQVRVKIKPFLCTL
jgi:hypothetical protein